MHLLNFNSDLVESLESQTKSQPSLDGIPIRTYRQNLDLNQISASLNQIIT